MSKSDRRLAIRGISPRWWAGMFLVQTLVVVSVVPWRTDDLYDGGIDPVVIGKAVVGFAAFGFALLFYRSTPVHGDLGLRTITLLLGITLISVLGAFAAGGAGPDVILAIRLLLVAATLVLTAMSVPPVDLLATMLAAMGAVAIVAAVTGASHGLATGRLGGGIPQMAPNVLAGLAAAPSIGLVVHIVTRGVRVWSVLLVFVFFTLIFATGSRTALIVVLVGMVVAFVVAPRLPISAAIGAIAIFPVTYALAAFTDTIAKVLSRGQTIEEISTFSSRTVAWQAVLATPFDSWAKWIGVGLAAQTVPVQQRFRNVQVLDSSWVSVIAQAGVIGTVLLVVWIVTTGFDSLRRAELIPLALPLFVMLFIRSFTENGLIESSPTFVLFFALSLVLEQRTRFPGLRLHAPTYSIATPLPISSAVERG